MPSLGPAEILVILVIALLVFGPNKMPDMARQVGGRSASSAASSSTSGARSAARCRIST